MHKTKYGPSVLFESPTTLILSGDDTNFLGEAIDIAKQSGYKVDSVTVFTEQDRPSGTTVYLIPVYTVFMSKG